MCNALKFPRSTYYKALINEPSNKRKVHQEFSQQLLKYFLKSNKRYGADKLCRELINNGITCSIKRVQRHMKLLGIRKLR